MDIKAKARLDPRTKNLVKRIQPGEIAIINHADLDHVAADSLVKARVKMVVNASPSITGRYPNLGPSVLLNEGINILDNVGKDIFQKIHEGDFIEVRENQIWKDNIIVAQGQYLESESVNKRLREIRGNLAEELEKFLQNTLEYASKEKDLILDTLAMPEVNVKFEGRPVLVVVRGQNYREDLTIIKPYIDDVNPVLIGVDGGADALLEFGYKPDLIVGDMDSVTDEALKNCPEIIVHAYPDGRAPGLKRIEDLNLTAKLFPAPGTSEDITLLLAYEKGADLIVAVGTHSNMIDFLEKGRAGMGSTFLVRLKVGSILVDARGVSKIYQGRLKLRYLVQLAMAGVLVIITVLYQTQWSRDFLRALWLQMKVLFNL
ncbi:putative membrane-anchored protein [Hydrogenispora ethanolica]|uniref:Putative membrane-anchored protein n=1 Tax=Hydrogenispora ethanolica TaxID=1082276 RepID=A0A4R1QYC1_HYDET|nr:putative cytokinetic ring protein SteA [Hydrogenispora ethanolica]TCL57120.1 putative membrane-anchored protein [Hydrogenispora ethanolica]